jgi:CRP-like cAMP-binding protein
MGAAGLASGPTLNSLANVQPSADKLTKIEVFAPKEEEELKVFDKTLNSDVSQAEAIQLLQKIDEKTSLFREFTFQDMAYLAQVLTILKFQPGDVIIESGEESSFVGMILQGELQVRFGDVVKPIPEGSLLGELSFFEGGTRTAAVSAGTHSIVGMITFNELEKLAEYAPTIRLKLMVLFALEGIKKMRLFSKPAAAAPPTEEEKTKEADTPYNQSKPPINKRMSGAMSTDPKKMSPSASQTAVGGAAADAKAIPDPRNRSLKRTGSLVGKDALGLTAGQLKDKAADAVAPTEPAKVSRNVEALFRIRMKSEQKAQQEKIEKALEKRKNAEHKARTTTVMADAYKKDLDKKQEFIEELYQENIDLKEYKAWAQKKHIADAKSVFLTQCTSRSCVLFVLLLMASLSLFLPLARFLKEKLEHHAEQAGQLTAETEKRKASERAYEELLSRLESMVAQRTKSYNEQIAELQQDVKKLQTRLEAGEKLRQTLEENLKLASHQKQLDEAKIGDTIKHVEETKLELTQQANEQIVQHLRVLTQTQDELQIAKRLARELEEKVNALSLWKEEAIEHQLQKEMLHQRLHRNLLENVDKHSALMSDVSAFKVILKYLLASCLVKNYRHRKHLRSIYLDHVEMLRKLNLEVAHQQAKGQGQGGRALQLGTLPPGSGPSGAGGESVHDVNDDGTLIVHFDDQLDADPTAGTDSALDRPSTNAMSQSRAFAQKAKCDSLFLRLNDLLPSLRTLIDEICSQKIYWNATADSFFRRTIELKQHLMDAEQTTGMKLMPTNAVGQENIHLHLNAKLLMSGGEQHTIASLEAANTTSRARSGSGATDQKGGNLIYQESKEETPSTNNSNANHNKQSRLIPSKPSPRSLLTDDRPMSSQDDDFTSGGYLKPPRPGYANGRLQERRGSTGGTDAEKSARAAGDASPSNTQTGSNAPGSGPLANMAELRDTRERMTFYRKRCKELKETNAMLSTRVASFAARLAELEEWQRNLYAHNSAATAVGLLGPVNSPQPALNLTSPLPLPPVIGATPHPLSMSAGAPHPSMLGGGADGNNTGRPGNKTRQATIPQYNSRDVTQTQSVANPVAMMGVSPTALIIGGTTIPGENPYLQANPHASTPQSATKPTASGTGVPVFQIKGGAAGASPMHSMYAALPVTPAPVTSSSNGIALILKRPAEPQNYVIQSGNQQAYTLNGAKEPLAPVSTQSTPHQPKPPSQAQAPASYLTQQMAAFHAGQSRYASGGTTGTLSPIGSRPPTNGGGYARR